MTGSGSAAGASPGSPRVIRAAGLPAGTLRVPVAIVGAGACGLTAALALADGAHDCVVLERDAIPQGSTALSSGFIPAAGTTIQAAAGIADSPEQFAADIQAKARGRASAPLVQAYTRAIAPALDALASRHGLRFEVLRDFLYPGHGVHRMHALPERTGAALMGALLRACEARAVPILTQARVYELWVSEAGGQVLGVGWCRPDGSIERVACEAVLLACNGFGGNPAMVRRWLPQMGEAVFAGHTGNDGSAISWGQALGARLADLTGYQGHGSWAVPQGVLISWALIMQGGIQVNARGERFHDETHGYSEAAVEVLAQPGASAWVVFDDPILTLAQDFPDFVQAQKAGALRHARGPEELARAIGCDPAVLADTLAGQAAATDQPDAYGRRFVRRLSAPFHAVRVTGALFHTQGGLDVDGSCRVLRADGSVLTGLYAAGGAARGVSGDAVWGYLSGNGLLSAVAGGWIAAHAILGARP